VTRFRYGTESLRPSRSRSRLGFASARARTAPSGSRACSMSRRPRWGRRCLPLADESAAGKGESVRDHRPGHPESHRIGVAAVASVSAGAHQPEGARRGGKEAAEVACADRDEGASEDQAPEEDLARQVETRHACPAALRGGRVLGGKHLKILQDARTKRWARSHSGGIERRKTIRRLRSGEAACRDSTTRRQRRAESSLTRSRL